MTSPMIDLKISDKRLASSLLAHKFDGNLYSLCNFSGKGLLVDLLASPGGEKSLTRELKHLVPLMYCGGRGLTVKEAQLMSQVPLSRQDSSGGKFFVSFLVKRKKGI